MITAEQILAELLAHYPANEVITVLENVLERADDAALLEATGATKADIKTKLRTLTDINEAAAEQPITTARALFLEKEMRKTAKKMLEDNHTNRH